MKSDDLPAIERVLDPVGRCLTPDVARAIIDVRLDAKTQAHLDKLAEKSTAGTLTAHERSQYEAYVSALDFLAILQSKARRKLKAL